MLITFASYYIKQRTRAQLETSHDASHPLCYVTLLSASRPKNYTVGSFLILLFAFRSLEYHWHLPKYCSNGYYKEMQNGDDSGNVDGL